MAKLSRDLSSGTLHPRENIASTASLGSLNAEIVINGDGASTVSIDLRGTFVATCELAGSVDGVNYTPIPVRPLTGGPYIPSMTVVGVYAATVAGFAKVRVRATAYTSGAATACILASTAVTDQALIGTVAGSAVTVTAATGVGATLTLPAPGAGLRHYITSVDIERYATALLVAGAAPTVVTTTNLPGSLAFSVPADAAAAGVVYATHKEFVAPLAAVAQNTATTIVAPVVTTVIWRITATYYIAP